MPDLTIRLQTLHAREPWWPDDDVLGDRLVALVERNLPKGAPTTAVVVHRRQAVLAPLKPFVDARVPPAMVLAGLARWDDGEGVPEAVALIGRVRTRQGSDGGWASLAAVFIEWPDGRWWHWQVLLDGEGRPMPATRNTARAVDGLARPGGLGGWWTLSRVRRPDLKLRRHTPELRSEEVQ